MVFYPCTTTISAADGSNYHVIVIQVYDVTSYIDDHPGGAESILLNAGQHLRVVT
jgi:cytochrome b involved in lipid metabolism